MKKIIFIIFLCLCCFSAFAEYKETLRIGDSGLLGYSEYGSDTKIITGIRKEDNLIFLEIAVNKYKNDNYLYLKYVFEDGELTPFYFFFYNPVTKSGVTKRVKIYSENKNEITFVSVD